MKHVSLSLRSLKKSHVLWYGITLGILFLTSYIYFTKAASFHFTDEYTNIVQSYFMTQGRTLYSEIFSHHQPIPNYISFGIQKVLPISDMYQLIIAHRAFVIFWSLFMNMLLILRFRRKALLFIILYETTKFFLFGNLFLSESLIVYPLVYLVGLTIEKTYKKPLYSFDYILATCAVWFLSFTREAYIPAACLLLLFLLWNRQHIRAKGIAIIIGILLTISTLRALSIPEYLYAVITLNSQGYIASELSGQGVYGIGIVKPLLYPFFIFITGVWNNFHFVLLVFTATYVFLSYRLIREKHTLLSVFLWIILGLLAIRYTVPGKLFYEGFHVLAWYATLLGIISFLLTTLTLSKKTFLLFSVCLPMISITALLTSGYYTPSTSRTQEFYENYTTLHSTGAAIKTLSQPTDTLLVDFWSTLVYWQAGLKPAYDYVFFLPVMQSSTRYMASRAEMFEKNPPTFYYFECGKDQHSPPILTDIQKKKYTQLHERDKKTICLFIRNDRYKTIQPEQWKAIERFGYYK